jgi:hypothetical protein
MDRYESVSFPLSYDQRLLYMWVLGPPLYPTHTEFIAGHRDCIARRQIEAEIRTKPTPIADLLNSGRSISLPRSFSACSLVLKGLARRMNSFFRR